MPLDQRACESITNNYYQPFKEAPECKGLRDQCHVASVAEKCKIACGICRLVVPATNKCAASNAMLRLIDPEYNQETMLANVGKEMLKQKMGAANERLVDSIPDGKTGVASGGAAKPGGEIGHQKIGDSSRKRGPKEERCMCPEGTDHCVGTGCTKSFFHDIKADEMYWTWMWSVVCFFLLIVLLSPDTTVDSRCTHALLPRHPPAGVWMRAEKRGANAFHLTRYKQRRKSFLQSIPTLC